jgi:RimJ/RimL family protein N-acetyltransferase
MSKDIPRATINALARSIIKEASSYGFGQIDVIRLVNELLDASADGDAATTLPVAENIAADAATGDSTCLPLSGENVAIRLFDNKQDLRLLRRWLPDKYGRFFVLSCATARSDSVDDLCSDQSNLFGVITTQSGTPIGALAFLEYKNPQRRAELRKLIGEPDYRGRGLAEEATRLWVDYGFNGLGLDKIYVSTLQTHLSNIQLNERIGFQVEGLLKNEVLIDGERHDVLRMGVCRQS